MGEGRIGVGAGDEVVKGREIKWWGREIKWWGREMR